MVVFALSYRVPPPLLPRWLRTEIADGRTPISRPDRGDMGCLWACLAFGALTVISVLLLVLVYHEAD
jgi:hypothetical protein